MNYEDTMNRLKKEFADAQRLQIEGADSGMAQQLAMQTVYEVERRRQDCIKLANDLRLQASAAEAQATGFSVVGSIMASIVHGFVVNEERRLDAELLRAKNAREEAEEAAAEKAKTSDEAPEPISTSENSDEPSEQESAGKAKKPAKKK